MLHVKKIPVDPPFESAGETVSEIVLREPAMDVVIVHGEPWHCTQTPEGMPLIVDNPEATSAYIDACLVSPSRQALQPGGVRVARLLKSAIDGFFLVGRAEGAGSTTSPMS